jgi:hypothetical protein
MRVERRLSLSEFLQRVRRVLRRSDEVTYSVNWVTFYAELTQTLGILGSAKISSRVSARIQ